MPRTMSRHAGAVRQRMGPVMHQVCTERGLTLAELARATGLSPSHLSRIERGVTRPSYVALDTIADALEMDIGTLLAAEKAALAVDRCLDPLLAQLGMADTAIAELRQLSPDTRAKLMDGLARVRSGVPVSSAQHDGLVRPGGANRTFCCASVPPHLATCWYTGLLMCESFLEHRP